MSAISQTHKRYLKDDDGNVYWPVAAWDAIIGLDAHLTSWTTDNSQFIYDQISTYIADHTLQKSVKLQSPNGTVFILSVDDDGKLITSKEEDSSGS